MLAEPVQQIIVFVVIILMIGLLVWEKYQPSYVFFVTILTLMFSGILSTDDFLKAFSNEAILSIFLLIFITSGIQEHFPLIEWMNKLFANARSGRSFMLRMTSGVALMSGFLNNTPIVALFMPYIDQWSQENNVAQSKLLIPLSFAAISGGMLTVIGTSTNLVLKGLAEAAGAPAPGFFDYLLPGILVSIGGILYLYFIGYYLLPDYKDRLNPIFTKAREYLVEVDLAPESDLIGKTVEEIDLTNLKGVYLFEIIRGTRRLTPVRPEMSIEEGDKLVFAGDSKTIMKILARDKDFINPFIDKDSDSLKDVKVVEAVVSFNSNLIGTTLKRNDFRRKYDASVLAIYRRGQKILAHIGDVKLQAGDLLLIVPEENFEREIRQNEDLYLVSVEKQIIKASRKTKKGFVAVLIIILLGLVLGKLSLFFALVILTSYMVGVKLLDIERIKQQFDVNLFVVLVCSLALSTAMVNSGAAQMLAESFIPIFSPLGGMGLILGFYIVTLVLTSFITNVAAVAIVFPLALVTAGQIPEINIISVFVAIAFAASASFHTPFSYQTNMMVYSPGGYKFRDYLKVGTPITLIYSAIVLLFLFLYY